jgi:hypothetical protein
MLPGLSSVDESVEVGREHRLPFEVNKLIETVKEDCRVGDVYLGE